MLILGKLGLCKVLVDFFNWWYGGFVVRDILMCWDIWGVEDVLGVYM